MTRHQPAFTAVAVSAAARRRVAGLLQHGGHGEIPGLQRLRGRVLAARIAAQSGVAVVEARAEFVTYDLLAYQPPLTQVLSLPSARLERKDCPALRALCKPKSAT